MTSTSRVAARRHSARGQCVTEYFILGGLLCFSAIAAICLYRDNIKALFAKPAATPTSDIASPTITEETTPPSPDAGQNERAQRSGQCEPLGG